MPVQLNTGLDAGLGGGVFFARATPVSAQAANLIVPLIVKTAPAKVIQKRLTSVSRPLDDPLLGCPYRLLAHSRLTPPERAMPPIRGRRETAHRRGASTGYHD